MFGKRRKKLILQSFGAVTLVYLFYSKLIVPFSNGSLQKRLALPDIQGKINKKMPTLVENNKYIDPKRNTLATAVTRAVQQNLEGRKLDTPDKNQMQSLDEKKNILSKEKEDDYANDEPEISEKEDKKVQMLDAANKPEVPEYGPNVFKKGQIVVKKSLHNKDTVVGDDTIPEIPDDLQSTLDRLLQRNFEIEGKGRCEKGYFKVEGMSQCRKWLECDEINNENVVVKVKKIGGGIGKRVFSGLLDGTHPLAIVFSRNPTQPRLSKRAMIGNQNLMKMQPSPYVIQVLGYCEQSPNSTIITESCNRCMDIYKLRKRNKGTFGRYDEKQRFEWATKIVGGFDFLHHGMDLPRVHCDLHTAEEALTQYLISSDGKIFMGDVDEVPEVDVKNGVYAKCIEETGGIMKTPEFIAPEQRYTIEEFKAKKSQKPITEKADVWKIPDITKILMQGAKKEEILLEKLEIIHKKCKSLDAKMRPSAREVFIQYLHVLKDVFA